MSLDFCLSKLTHKITAKSIHPEDTLFFFHHYQIFKSLSRYLLYLALFLEVQDKHLFLLHMLYKSINIIKYLSSLKLFVAYTCISLKSYSKFTSPNPPLPRLPAYSLKPLIIGKNCCLFTGFSCLLLTQPIYFYK